MTAIFGLKLFVSNGYAQLSRILRRAPLFGLKADAATSSEINFVISVVADEQGLRHIDYSKIDATRPMIIIAKSGHSVG